MRTLFRTLIVLSVVLAVSGATWALVQAGGAQYLNLGEEGQRSEQFLEGAAGFDGPRPAEGFRGRGERGDDGGLALASLLKNLVIIGVIVSVVVTLSLLGARLCKRWRRASRPQPPASPLGA